VWREDELNHGQELLEVLPCLAAEPD
jgi:hypothetical protein